MSRAIALSVRGAGGDADGRGRLYAQTINVGRGLAGTGVGEGVAAAEGGVARELHDEFCVG